MALPNTFKSFVGVLLDLVVFSDSVSLLKTTLHWVLLVSEKMFLERIVKEVWVLFIRLYNFTSYFFSKYGKELVKVIIYYKWVGCLLIIYFKTVCLLSFFVYVNNKLDSIPRFKHILFEFIKIFLIMIPFTNFSDFVYSILVCIKLIV